MKIKNTEIKIVRGNITTLSVDAIVNAANNKLVMGGGVAGAIKRVGGEKIEKEAVKKGPIEIGKSIYTSAGSLPSKYVIHAATMGMDFKTNQDKVRASCASALIVANDLNINSVAFVALGCGTGKFPLVGAAKIMTQEVLKFLKKKETNLKEIIFCLYDKQAFEVFDTTVKGYVAHIKDNLGEEPYITVDIIIEVDGGIVIIERSNPPYGWALPGGFVDEGETLEEAAIREAREETNLDLEDVKEFNKYSDPSRDPRFHTISTVFIAKGVGIPQSGDDAKNLKVVKYEDLLNQTYAFDHKKIISEYLSFKGN